MRAHASRQVPAVVRRACRWRRGFWQEQRSNTVQQHPASSRLKRGTNPEFMGRGAGDGTRIGDSLLGRQARTFSPLTSRESPSFQHFSPQYSIRPEVRQLPRVSGTSCHGMHFHFDEQPIVPFVALIFLIAASRLGDQRGNRTVLSLASAFDACSFPWDTERVSVRVIP
jgi:hypothetical protein